MEFFANGKRISKGFLPAYSQYQIEGYGKSTEEKPTDVPDNTMFYEKDTKKVYLFDLETKTWLEQ